MTARAVIVALAVAAASLVAVGAGVATAQEAPRVCIWGGTLAAPTGTFVIEPGLRNTPSPVPLEFKATGPAEGDACRSTVTFQGVIRAGSSCAVLHFEGRVRGVPGVQTFWGPGSAVMTSEFLYDPYGNHVGFNNPTILSQATAEQIAESPNSCNSPEGFTHGHFSSTIELFADRS